VSPIRLVHGGFALLLSAATATAVDAWSCGNLALNKLENCGFDSPANDLTPWSFAGTWIHQWHSLAGAPGSSPLGEVLAGTNAASTVFQMWQCRSVMPNTAFDYGAWMNNPGNAVCALLLDVYTGAGCTGGTAQNDVKLFASGAWSRAGDVLTMAGTAVSARLMISCTSIAAVTLEVDEALLVPRRCRHIFRDGFEAPDVDTCEWGAGCPGAGLQVEEAISLRPDRMLLCFNHTLDATTVSAGGGNVTFDNGLTETAAAASGNELLVSTTGQGMGTSYTVTAAPSLEDIFGAPASGDDASALFTGYDGP
jgi:hypothetical protein